MSDALLTCSCGHVMRLSAFAVGSRGRCPRCQTVITVREQDLQPVANTTEPATSAEPERCARCSKPFKGDWDRVELGDNVFCHHCSVLAVEDIPKDLRAPKDRNDDAPRRDPSPLNAPRREPFTQAPWFRHVLLMAALGVVLLTIVLTLTTDFSVPASTTISPEAEAIELPRWAEWALETWGFIATFIAGLIALYVALAVLGKLPEESFWRNAAHVAVATAVLTAMHVTLSLAAVLIGPVPMAGPIYGALLRFARIVLAYFILDWFFDYSLPDFILTLVIYGLLRFVVMDVVEIAFAGALYHMAA